MKKQLSSEKVSRTIPNLPGQRSNSFSDNRPEALAQAKLIESIREKADAASLLWGSEAAGKLPGYAPAAFPAGYTGQGEVKGPEPSPANVVQRVATHIQDRWDAYVALIQVPRRRRLVHTNRSDVIFVAQGLEEAGHWVEHEELIRGWNLDQPRDLIIQQGTPTENFMRVNPDVPERDDIAFIGSDSPSRDTDRLPGNVLEPLINQFCRLAAEATQVGRSVPIHMASYLSRVRDFYGDKARPSNLSQHNLDMLADITRRGIAVLLLHPDIEPTRSTREERSIVTGAGYAEDQALWEDPARAPTRAELGFDPPVLYTRQEGEPVVDVNNELMQILRTIAQAYIALCRAYIEARSQAGDGNQRRGGVPRRSGGDGNQRRGGAPRRSGGDGNQRRGGAPRRSGGDGEGRQAVAARGGDGNQRRGGAPRRPGHGGEG